MTHRSRMGGPPPRHKTGKPKTAKKLHHPPPRPTSPSSSEDSESEPDIPFSKLSLKTPSNPDILAVIHHSLESTLEDPTFLGTIQKIKGLLYEQKWLDVFNDAKGGYLDVYAGRWVPSRALCFRELLGIRALREIWGGGNQSMRGGRKGKERAGSGGHVISLGGGAGSELLAIAAILKSFHQAKPNTTPANATVDDTLTSAEGSTARQGMGWKWTGVDIGDWAGVLDKFQGSIRSQWGLEEEDLEIEFIREDLLSTSTSSSTDSTMNNPATPESQIDSDSTPTESSKSTVKSILSSNPPTLLTLLFTTTELLHQSRSSTITLFNLLTSSSPKGTYLLIADSASDIAEFTLGSGGRTWPVWMVVDTLLGVPLVASLPGGEGESDDIDEEAVGQARAQRGRGKMGRRGAKWEVVKESDSSWFRLGEEGREWKCKLENVRYWMRLYRRI